MQRASTSGSTCGKSTCFPSIAPTQFGKFHMARNVRQSLYYSFIPRRFLNRLSKNIWCRDFTIICITKKLEVKMLAYTSFISDVHKSYRVEKLILHDLIFLLICVYWFQTQFYHNCKYKFFIWQKHVE